MNDDQFMQLAIREARLSLSDGDRPFGCVIVERSRMSKIVARASNREVDKESPLAHAEIEAIETVIQLVGVKTLARCTLYTTHEPCAMCCGVITQVRIPRVVIGSRRADRPDLFRQRNLTCEALLLDARHPPELVVGVLRDVCLALLDGAGDRFG